MMLLFAFDNVLFILEHVWSAVNESDKTMLSLEKNGKFGKQKQK